MKTTQECWQALIDGEKLQHIDGHKSAFVELSNGMLKDHNGNPMTFIFNFPEDWKIYTPPKWYDNIPDGGVPCWVYDYALRKKAFVVRHNDSEEFPFTASCGSTYRCATPLTKQEIQVLLDNAPEGEQE